MEELFIDAARDGNLQEVRNLLQKGTDVNATNAYGDSGLMKASFHDRTDIVKELLRHDGVDVNHWNVEGETALMLASCKGHIDIVEELLKQETLDVNHRNKNHKTALDLAKQYDHNGTVARLNEHVNKKQRFCTDQSRDVLGMELLETRIKQAQDSICSMMEHRAFDSVDLYREYIEMCTTATVVGNSAFGTAYLAKDNKLPNTFVVKMIQLTTSDQATINELRTSLQQKVTALTHADHPNILDLYGYSFSTNHTHQYLAYEHAANGRLDGFLRETGKSAQLTASIRLSIMDGLTVAVHSLHTVGCFHRDIQSSNIWLSDDYTAQLMDCGLAKFVPIINNAASTTSSVVTLW